MDRRAFIKRLLSATAAAQLIDIEELLWVPKPMIVVPRMPLIRLYADTSPFDEALTRIAIRYLDGRTFIADRVLPVVAKSDGPHGPVFRGAERSKRP